MPSRPLSPSATRRATTRPAWLSDVAVVTFLILLAGWVHRRPLMMFFGPDDFVHIEQALGIRPPSLSPIRYLSQNLYFATTLGIFGPYPPAFHLQSLCLHLINVAAAYFLLRKLRSTRTLALLAIGLFALAPLHFPALLYAVNINDIGVLSFAIITAACAAGLAFPLGGMLAAFAFVVGFFCKESLVLCAFLLPFLPRLAPREGRVGRGALPAIACATALTMAYLYLRTTGAAPGGVAYEMAFGANVFHNIATYAAWFTNVTHPIPDLVGSYDPAAWLASVPMAAVLLGLALWDRHARPWILGGLLFFLFAVAPVAVLVRHTYAHYAYSGALGLAVAFAAAITALGGVGRRLLGRAWGARRGSSASDHSAPRHRILALLSAALSCGIVAVYALHADRLLERRVTQRVRQVDLPLDPYTRKVTVGARAILSAAPAIDEHSRILVLFSLPGDRVLIGTRAGTAQNRVPSDAPTYDLLTEVLDQGQAFRIFWPTIDSVVFTDTWRPDHLGHDFFLRDRAGFLLGFGREPAGLTRAAQLLYSADPNGAVCALAESLAVVMPDDCSLLMLMSRACARQGRESSAAWALQRLQRACPDSASALGTH